jgi:ATP-dependent exoDNAse (exonuclease V) alpha subunit
MTAGYAFTDYKSQGQTIEYVIIDIGKPPTGTLSPFSVYAALSRSRGRESIRLPRDFEP